MMTVCRRYVSAQHHAEDIMQEAFIRVFSNLHQFRFQGSLEGWIRKIVVRAALRHIERANVAFEQIEIADVPVNEEVMSELNEEELLNLIQQLPAGYRTVFNLYVIDGYTHEEIGGMLNIEPVTSRTQLSKARKMLQQKITDLSKAPRYER